MLKTGDRAEILRQFSQADLDDYQRISGTNANINQVTEPMICALFSYLLGMELPGLGTNYLKQECQYHRLPKAGETLLASVEITRLRPEKCLVDLETRCQTTGGELLCQGRALVYAKDVEGAFTD